MYVNSSRSYLCWRKIRYDMDMQMHTRQHMCMHHYTHVLTGESDLYFFALHLPKAFSYIESRGPSSRIESVKLVMLVMYCV